MRSSDAAAAQPFPYLLGPVVRAVVNRARRRERGDVARGLVFSAIAALVALALFAFFFWLTWQMLDYEELGEYLIRLGLSWLFLTFLSFLAFSGIVTSLSAFFLSEDLHLLMALPVSKDRLFYARFAKTLGQASWMVVAFLLPVLLGVGAARCSGPRFYLSALVVLVPFVLIPVAFGSVVTLVLVNVFPARRARDVLMLLGLLFAVTLVLLLRFIRPETLLRVESLPDVTAFFATLQSPVTPFLPSFWAGEALFSALRGQVDLLHLGALWTTALAFLVLARSAYTRLYFAGWSKAQEARKARFRRLQLVEQAIRALRVPPGVAHLLVKDIKVFLRDTTQWSQLLLLVALMLVYLYNFRVLDLERIPYMSGVIRNIYAFVNLALAAFVLAAIAVRFVFPAVSVEGPAFWVIRTSPVSMRAFLWSKFWTGLVPVLVMTETLTVLSNEYLGASPFLKALAATAVLFMTFALVGLAAGMGAQHPRFNAENVTQVAGSYGGIAFMVLAVLFTIVTIALLAWPSSIYLYHLHRGSTIPTIRTLQMAASFGSAAALSIACFLVSMARGVRALNRMGG